MQSKRPGTTPIASSKSIEFNANGAKLSAVAVPSPVFHASVSYILFYDILINKVAIHKLIMIIIKRVI